MPRLPASPNLEHLKGQARRLHRAHGAAEPEALVRVEAQLPRLGAAPGDPARPLRLADAQFVVAREYGFASWPGLKAHLEAPAAELEPPSPAVPFGSRARSTRGQFVHELSGALAGWARRHDAGALGARFGLMPLRDILAVRDELATTHDIGLVVDGLVEGLGHHRPRVRFDCANALDHMADERCAAPLRRLLDDPVPRVRRAALHSLSCDACKLSPLTPGEALVPKLIEMALRDPSVRVRRSAVPVLENHCRDERLEAVLRSLEAVLRSLAASDGDATVRRTAGDALRRRGGALEPA